jgi:hypothetical protein
MSLFNGKKERPTGNVWARPEMLVTFRAEIMPGRSSEERTYRVKEVKPNGRVTLYDFKDEHLESEFEPLNFLRKKTSGHQS